MASVWKYHEYENRWTRKMGEFSLEVRSTSRGYPWEITMRDVLSVKRSKQSQGACSAEQAKLDAEKAARGLAASILQDLGETQNP